jgi:transcriptional regulator with GAF, ATPase, and Fis domain
MAEKPRHGAFTMKEERHLIALAATGTTVEQAAAKLRTTAATIQRMAGRLGIQLKGSQDELGLKAKGK